MGEEVNQGEFNVKPWEGGRKMNRLGTGALHLFLRPLLGRKCVNACSRKLH